MIAGGLGAGEPVRDAAADEVDDPESMDEYDRMIVDVTDRPEPVPGPSKKARQPAAKKMEKFDFSSDSELGEVVESSSGDADFELPGPKKRRGKPTKRSEDETGSGTAARPAEVRPARKRSAGRKKGKKPE
jgi:hypothetical protein